MSCEVDVTLIVIISEHLAESLESWVNVRGGTVEPWDPADVPQPLSIPVKPPDAAPPTASAAGE